MLVEKETVNSDTLVKEVKVPRRLMSVDVLDSIPGERNYTTNNNTSYAVLVI